MLFFMKNGHYIHAGQLTSRHFLRGCDKKKFMAWFKSFRICTFLCLHPAIYKYQFSVIHTTTAFFSFQIAPFAEIF